MAKSFRSDCPIARALEVVGDAWTLLLIRDMGAGKRTYQEMLTAGEGIPTNILAARLTRLVEAGLIEKHPYQDKPRRFEYHLTASGRGLLPVVTALETWGIAEFGGARRAEPSAEPEKVVPKRRSEWAFGPEDSVW